MGAARLLSMTSCPVSYLTIGRSIARGNQVSKEARPTSKPAGVIENRATTRDAKRAAAPGLLHASPWAPWVVRHRPQRKGFVLTPLPTAHVPTSLALPARHFKTPSRHPVQVPTTQRSNLKTAVYEGFKARTWLSYLAKKSLGVPADTPMSANDTPKGRDPTRGTRP